MKIVSCFCSLVLFLLTNHVSLHESDGPLRELQSINFCTMHNDCYFGGTCIKVGQIQLCSCPPNYDGPNCEYAPTNSCSSGWYFPLQKEPLALKTPTCSKCHPQCKECFGASNSQCSACQTCAGGGQCQVRYLQNFKCVLRCSPGFYKQGNNCKPCHANCAECTGNAEDNCTACDQQNQLKILNKVSNTCVQNCPQGTYQSADGSECLACHSNCLACVGPNNDQCLLCKSQFKKHGWSCLSNCPSGTQTTGSICNSICNADQYSLTDSTTGCQKCDEQCATCTIASVCTSCKNNYFYNILTGYCTLNCPSGTYPNQSQKLCLKCPKNCATCEESGLRCTTCKSGFLKEEHYCNQQCNLNYYQFQNQCQACQPLCKRCINGNVNGCTECFSHPTIPIPSLLDDGQCVKTCSEGKAEVNGKCYAICGINSYTYGGNCLSCPQFISDFSNSEKVLAIIGACTPKLNVKALKALLSIMEVQQSRLMAINSPDPMDSYSLFKRLSNLLISAVQQELIETQGSMQFFKHPFSKFSQFIELDPGNSKGASLSLKFPQELTSQTGKCAAISVVRENIFGFSKIGQFETPVLDIVAFDCNTKEKVSISKLSKPVILRVEFRGSTQTKYFSGKYFNQEIQEWSTLGIESKIVDGKLELSISHFSAFAVVEDNQEGVSLRVQKQTYLLPLIVAGILLFFMMISGIIDSIICCHRQDKFPHLSSHFHRTHFCWLFYYSFIYNFPILNFYSYLTTTIWSTFKVMAFSICIWVILLIQILCYSLQDVSTREENFKYIVGFITGILLIPNTLLHYFILTEKSIRYRVSSLGKMDSQRNLKDITPLTVMAKTGMGESEQEANGTQIVNELRHVSKIEEQEKMQSVSGYAIGMFIFFTFLIWIVAPLVINRQLHKLDQADQQFFQDIIECFLAALVSGLVLSFVKIIIACSFAFHCPTRINRHRFVRCLFVDMLTRKVSLDLSGQALGESSPQFHVERRSIPPSQI